MFQPTTFGKYFLTRRIAVGGMAEVFHAKLFGADGFEKDLVIKQILPQHAREPEFVQSFVAEAKIVVTLNHANIVGIYELGRVDRTYFIAMEYVDGFDAFTLNQVAEKHCDSIGVGHALLIAEEVAKGLDYAHRKLDPTGAPLGLVHRDLNPRNVLVSREGEVKILDFGIAKTEGSIAAMPKTRAGMVKGTAGYMSPEQAMGRDVDARTDIYQAGLLLFELVTGRPLFWRPDDDETRNLMRRHQVDLPSSLVDAPSDVDDIIMAALARDPARRIQTAAELSQWVAKVRSRHFPRSDHRTLGQLVDRLLTLERREEEEDMAHLLATAEFGDAFAQVPPEVAAKIETIADRSSIELSEADFLSEAHASTSSGHRPISIAHASAGGRGVEVRADSANGGPRLRGTTGVQDLTPGSGIADVLEPSSAPAPIRRHRRSVVATLGVAIVAALAAVASGVALVMPSDRATSSASAASATSTISAPSAVTSSSPSLGKSAVATGTPVAVIHRSVSGRGVTNPESEALAGFKEVEPRTSPELLPRLTPQVLPREAIDPAERSTSPGEGSHDRNMKPEGAASRTADSGTSRRRIVSKADSSRSSDSPTVKDPPGHPSRSETALIPHEKASISFGTKGCSGRAFIDGVLVATTLPAYDVPTSAGRHLIKLEGTDCPRRERPGSLGSSVPVVLQQVTLEPGQKLKLVADFDLGTASMP